MEVNFKLLILVIIICLLFLFISGFNFEETQANNKQDSEEKFVPEQGFVPREATAKKIAEAVWLPIYGEEIYEYKPFEAKLTSTKKVWIVKGTLESSIPSRNGEKSIVVGGVPYAKIRKKDAKIIEVYHTE
jgi:hypothetical protein